MTIQQNFPNSRPSLNLNFGTSTKLDPVVTFSRTTSGTQINRNGFIESVPADTARFDHDPVTLEPRGLLVEEGRTNYYWSSAYTDNDGFGVNSSTILKTTDPNVNAPNGQPAFLYRALDGSNFHGFTGAQITGIEATTTVSYSCWIRDYNNSDYRLYFVLSAYNPTTNNNNYNLRVARPLTGKFVGGSPGSRWSGTITDVEDWGNGWHRFFITSTYNFEEGRTVLSFGFQLLDNTSQQFYTPSPSGVYGLYAYGPQLEIGSSVSSYIPVPSGSNEADRGTDNVTIEGDNFTKWFNQTEGTIFADMGPYVSEDTGNFGISIGSASNNYLAFPYIGGSGTYSRTTYWREPSIAATSQPLTTGDTAGKYANAYKNGQRLDQAFNGTLGTFGGSLPSPTGYDSLYIGRSHFTPGERQNFYLKRLVYYPSALSNAILQTITK